MAFWTAGWTLGEKIDGVTVGTVTNGGAAVVVNARGFASLTIITGSGCTATISRVDSESAGANTGGASDQTVAATTKSVITVDWPFYRLSASGGDFRYALA
jgi:hypothetical protein